MVIYIVNENVLNKEVKVIEADAPSASIKLWPNGEAAIPGDLEAGILIVRASNTSLEEARVIALINSGATLTCLYLSELPTVSELARKYCTMSVAVGSGGLEKALLGNLAVQEGPDGQPAASKKHKPPKCS